MYMNNIDECIDTVLPVFHCKVHISCDNQEILRDVTEKKDKTLVIVE
jgi:hypothetical protein